LRNGKFDAVLVFGWHLKSLIQAIVAAKKARTPVMVRGDSQLLMQPNKMKVLLKNCIYPFGLRAFDAALYVGKRSREYYEHYRYPSERLFFSPHCIDTQRFSEQSSAKSGAMLRQCVGISREEKVVLFAGKLLSFKRPLDLLDAAALLQGEGRAVTVMIAGSGPLEQEMRNRAMQVGVKIVFLGFKNQKEMPACYNASDVLVLPSTGRETWGLVANEALACGCPIIVSNVVGCAPDLADDGLVGRTFPMGDYRKLAEAVEAVLDRPPSLDAIRRRANAYDINHACEGIIEATKFVMSRRRVA
jgi:glycosyltransferase involved in cell wall biosynthesis